MLNGVEVEMINLKHFWRLIESAGFKTLRRERNVVAKIFQHNFLEVKSFSNILSQLGILDEIPKGTKNFDYHDLSGCGIRIINKIIREMKENKITNIVDFIGKENIEMKEVVAKNKSEVIETISPDKFLSILRKKKILRRWEDLDENLQTFLGVSSYICEQLMVRKLKK